jgi:hypothetical protein
MSPPDNHTLRLLREFREEFREFGTKTDKSFAQIQERFNSLQQPCSAKAFSAVMRPPSSKSGFPPLSNVFPLWNGAGKPIRPSQLSATFTDDSGNSWPKQRW